MKSRFLYKTILFAVLFVMASPGAIPANNSNINVQMERSYLHHKSRCNHHGALRILESWTAEITDPLLFEVNLFRIEELLEHPELNRVVFRIIDKLSRDNPVIQKNSGASARLDILKSKCLLRLGRIGEASSLTRNLGFVKRFKMIGPFSNESPLEFTTPYPPEKGYFPHRLYRGKQYPVSWYDAQVNLAGIIDLDEIKGESENSLYYLTASIHVDKKGTHLLRIGKTGFTDIWINGVRVFSNRKRHRFKHDQYVLPVSLSPGTHTIMVKTGSTPGSSIRFSLRITDTMGNPVIPRLGKNGTASGKILTIMPATYFESLDKLINRKKLTPRENFVTAYLIHRSQVNSSEAREAVEYFNRAAGDPIFAGSCFYYLGSLENNTEKKEYFLNKSLQIDPARIESLRLMARIRIDNRFLYEALPYIQRIESTDPLSPVALQLRADLFLSRGWPIEALKISKALLKSPYPSVGHLAQAVVFMYQKKYNRAFSEYEKLLLDYPLNREWIKTAVRLGEKCGAYRRTLSILESSLVYFPRDSGLRLNCAQLTRTMISPEKALPYLSAAMAISPFSRDVLYQLSLVYRMMGREKLGISFLKRAARYAPGDFPLKQYYDFISGEKSGIEPYLEKKPPLLYRSGTEKFNSEPAVILLDEHVIHLLPDGSHERWIRKIIAINDESSIEEFSRHYIILNPRTDRLENLSLSVLNNGSVFTSSKTYTQSLSDPESRLYYDLNAEIITTTSLRKGSIIELKYRLKSGESSSYRGYFGHGIAVGGEYRTIRANIVISYPDSRPIYCFFKNMHKNTVTRRHTGKGNIIHIVLKNIKPYKKEPLMPHYSEIRPAIYITSHKNWRSLHNWYSSLIKNKAVMNNEMRGVLNDLVSANENKSEKIRKIFDFVNSHIRYVGFELGLGSLQPRSSDITFQTGMGDCKDVATLLIALLREIGIDAKIALVRTREKGNLDLSIPYIGQFNHAICYVNHGGGLFLDATAKLTGSRELPSSDRNLTALVLDEKGYRFINTGEKPYSPNTETAVTKVHLSSDGSAQCHRTIIKEGSFTQNARYDLLDRENKFNKVAHYWNKRFSGTRISNIEVLKDSVDNPVVYSYNLRIPHLAGSINSNLVLRAFLIPSNYYKQYTLMKNRRFPVGVTSHYRTMVIIKYTIPKDYQFSRIPLSEKREHGKFAAHFSYTKTGPRVLEVRSTIRFKDYSIKASEYGSFREFCRFIHRKESERIILSATKAAGRGKR